MKNTTHKISLFFVCLLVYGIAQAMESEELTKEAQKSMDPLFLAMQVGQASRKKPVQDPVRIKSVVVKNNGFLSEQKDECRYVCQHKECLFKTNYKARFESHERAHDTIRRYPHRLVYQCTDCDLLTTVKRTYQDHLNASGHTSQKDY